MKDWRLETKEDDDKKDDGVDDAGTISFHEDREEAGESVYPIVNIKIDRQQYSIFELKRRYDRGAICLNPEYQRNYVWKSKQKSELIESVIMGIPLPLIYLAETMQGALVIVDGRQRLTTFFDYLDNKFSLKGLNILPELNGCKFHDLEKDEDRRRFASVIEDFQLIIQIIKYPTPDRVRFDIFDRVNRGGTPLNNQEMRNALYQGHSTKLLKELAEKEEFKEATGHSISPAHMKDRYIILRAIGFYFLRKGQLVKKNGEKVKYKSDIEELLGITMEQLNRMSSEGIERLEQLFCEVMECVYSTLGPDAFRIPTDSGRRRPVSMTLFESLFYFFALLAEGESNAEREKICTAVDEMLEDSVFLEALTYNVDSKIRVDDRFQVVTDKYEELTEW